DREALVGLLELSERLHPYADLWAPRSWWRSQTAHVRPGLHTADDRAIAELGQQIDAAIPVSEQREAAIGDEPVTPTALDAGRGALAVVRRALDEAREPDDRALLAAVVASPSVDLATVSQAWTKHSTALTKWTEPTQLAERDVLGREAAVLESYAGRFVRFFSPTWWRSRGALRKALALAWPERAGAGFDRPFLQEIQGRVAATRAWETTQAAFDALGVGGLSPKNTGEAQTRLAKLEAIAAIVAELRAGRESLDAVGVALPEKPEAVATTDETVVRREAQLAALDAARTATEPLRGPFPWATDASTAALRELRERLRVDGPRLRESDGWLSQLDTSHALGRDALDRVATTHPEADAMTWREALARGWGSAHLEVLHRALPQLGELGTTAEGQTLARASEAMRELDLQIRTLELDTIRAGLDEAELLAIPDAKYRARRTPEQKLKEHLLKEVGKSRRLMPLRQFVRTFSGDGLLDVMPCWLVSPETMAVLFPRKPLFDLVIFDEASQCTVEAGFPVTLRAKRVVVAGDDKQMPPTSFFTAGSGEFEDEDLSEQSVKARDAFAAESLLVLARNRCAHVGLRWHYRCRSEELIAYSNHSMYDGDLLTIPSTTGPRAPSALSWIDVPDGKYEAGLNRPEAERVVDLLLELLSRDKRPTVGVVTFNLKQRQTILDAIEHRSANDPEFAERWAAARDVDALDERPFVKNLESVQGDERDIIIFSLGHAPVMRRRKGGAEELYVPARFGPLGQRGGERRLNVAISRAKRGCYVVSSFDPRLLHVGQSMHSGPRLFKGYLEFAHAKSDGLHDKAVRVLDEVRGTRRDERAAAQGRVIDGHLPLAAQIAYELEKRGVITEQAIGSSHFQIPLAVAKPGAEDGRFALAILTDEGGRGVSAFDQYVHQPLVLGLRGWDVMHVDAAAWSRRRAEVLDHIVARVGA
ncbi:MAG: AAA domain-containing protein, partial [Myxococcota bacterium]